MRQTILAVLSLSTMAALLTGCGGDMVLLNSKGPVAQGQSDLMMTAIYLNAIGGNSINHYGIMVWLEISRVE
jgi:heme/copper-type cytochrome/quinol oxidase subunit 2